MSVSLGTETTGGSQEDRGCCSWWERVWRDLSNLLLRTGKKTLSELPAKEYRCIDHFLVAVTKPDKSNLKEERFILAHSWKEHSPSWKEGMAAGA